MNFDAKVRRIEKLTGCHYRVDYAPGGTVRLVRFVSESKRWLCPITNVYVSPQEMHPQLSAFIAGLEAARWSAAVLPRAMIPRPRWVI